MRVALNLVFQIIMAATRAITAATEMRIIFLRLFLSMLFCYFRNCKIIKMRASLSSQFIGILREGYNNKRVLWAIIGEGNGQKLEIIKYQYFMAKYPKIRKFILVKYPKIPKSFGAKYPKIPKCFGVKYPKTPKCFWQNCNSLKK